MVAFTTHDYFLFSRKEIWFYDGGEIKKGTYNMFSAAKQINGQNAYFLQKYQTVEIDLTKTEEELFNHIHPRLSYDIRLAEKKGMDFIVLSNPSESECLNVLYAFNLFIKNKPIAPMSRRWIMNLQKLNCLYITKIVYNNTDVVTHVFLKNNKTILNTQSFHHVDFKDETISKFANKLLHWKDILYFKTRGAQKYNFGPINNDLKGITQFKMSFGGNREEYYRYIKTAGWIYFLKILLEKIRKIIELADR